MENNGFNIEKLKILLSYWISHNREHMADEEKWFKKAEEAGFMEVSEGLRETIKISERKNEHLEAIIKKLQSGRQEKVKIISKKDAKGQSINVNFRQIGIIHTPYTNNAPYQPVENDEGEFFILLDSDYSDGLNKLSQFRYAYVIYYIHRLRRGVSMSVIPPWAEGRKVGLFASRSPLRPNPIGLSVVKIKKIVKNKIFTSGLDVFDGTPLLDIKPYIKDLDSKNDANYGWIDESADRKHLILHIKGIPHEY